MLSDFHYVYPLYNECRVIIFSSVNEHLASDLWKQLRWGQSHELLLPFQNIAKLIYNELYIDNTRI